MNFRLISLVFLLISLFSGPVSAAAGNEITSQLRRLSTARSVGTETLQSGRALLRLYQERDYQLLWSDGDQLLAVADELIAALPAVAVEGFSPQRYHHSALLERSAAFRTLPNPRSAAELDLLLSDAFMLLAVDSLSGRIAPKSVDPDWNIPRQEGDPVRMLTQALLSGRIRDSLHALLPQDPAYDALRRSRQDYLRLAAAGGWPQLKWRLKLPLRSGAIGSEVVDLRQRLALTGDLLLDASSSETFDPELSEAVQHFQTRHGLTVDGIVGPATLAALNVTADQRAAQLTLNLERWRWLPRHFGERYLRVNLPAFHLELIEGGATVLDMRVIVGRQVRQTPAFVGKMTYLVLNPYWEVPNHLAVVDLLPKIQKDPNYLTQEGIKVFIPGGSRLNPAGIDWQQLGGGNFPYHLRQDPGPKNSLGQIKFIFPNSYNIYLHDTPSRKLFARDQRSFSSGCIRIEKPFALAERLLQGSPLAPPAVLNEALKSVVSQVVPLPTPVPVYILYWTAWVDADGTVNFRNDLYQRDHRLDAALRQVLL